MDNEKRRKKLKGLVTSDKMNKTVVVTVSTSKMHPKYFRYFTRSSKFKAHDENNQYKVGDNVIIEETRPLSREKRWRVVGLLKEQDKQR
ncbi:MAG: 30S ribosomal protein S17 [Candidatus Colwellbacteria bacterium]|nr:30S ribosomal protein S17 [Candidatus Colwellbacteria bacterium]